MEAMAIDHQIQVDSNEQQLQNQTKSTVTNHSPQKPSVPARIGPQTECSKPQSLRVRIDKNDSLTGEGS